MTIHLTFDPPEPALLNAFEIALNYLVLTGQVKETVEAQHEIAHTPIQEWNAGKHHRIWLANKAIAAFEKRGKKHL